MDDVYEDGKAEGLEKGRSEGLEKGLAEGRVEGVAEGAASTQRATLEALRAHPVTGALSAEELTHLSGLPLSQVMQILLTR